MKDWAISVLPSSIRLDPATNEIIDYRFISLKDDSSVNKDLLKKNWIYNGERATLHGARGEYVSFQLVLTNNDSYTLKSIRVEMFSNNLVKPKTNVKLISGFFERKS